jgi:hypothetical protein
MFIRVPPGWSDGNGQKYHIVARTAINRETMLNLILFRPFHASTAKLVRSVYRTAQMTR